MTPRSEYQQRVAARKAVVEAEERRHVSLGNWRLWVMAAAALLAWMAFGRKIVSPFWLTVAGGVFAGLAVYHERVMRTLGRAARAAAFYQRGLARLEDRWAGQGESGDRFRDPHHPYADDLDLFGEGSLFEMLSSARTRAGEETLARWLQQPAARADIEERQAAVNELRGRLDLREALFLLGEDVRTGVHPEELARWGGAHPLLDGRAFRAAAALLPLVTLSAAALMAVNGMRWPLLAALAVQIALAFRLRGAVLRVLGAVEQPSRDLALLAEVLGRIERERFESPRLERLRAAMETGGAPPSQRIRRLARLIELADSRRNLVFAPIAALLLWGTQFAFAIEGWRRKSGPSIRGWLEAVGEFEALSSLAGYAFEHPADPFPVFGDAGPCFDGVALAHPLLPAGRVVPNDVRLDPAQPLILVSGSNMSGKSTLLRTVGVNAVLAMAGAPVRAQRLTLSPLAVGASIRIVDSLQEGSSRFFAEITRLRQVVDLTRGSTAVLFLLDELLNGTNSHDRRIGAAGVVQGLVERGAIGLVTTHDLALTQIAEAIEPPGINMHFEDHLENGRISFDYHIRPGVVAKSNALELMRSVGLDV